jgi:hypothetical protein
MAEQAPRVIPGVPMAALDNIADQNVRDVLRAIVDGWHVRNGASGTGGQRFVTADEVGLSPGRTAVGGGYGNNLSTPGNTTITPAQIGRIINDLQAQVIESPLFKALGERVNLIDKPGGIFDRIGATELVLNNEIQQRSEGDTALSTSLSQLGTRVGEAEAGLQTETSQRVNSYNALQQTTTTQYTSLGQSLGIVQQQVNTVSNSVSSQGQMITQVQASVGQASTAIQQEATARANADGEINGKYSVKIDANGYVSGFGLISYANNSTPFSDFTVRADRFAIGSPSGPGIAPQVPFIVTAVGRTVGGVYAPPGVYIKSAFIENGSIARAQIGLAEIDTLRIAGNTVTVAQVVTGSSPITGNGSVQTVLSATLYVPYDGYYLATAAMRQGYFGAPELWSSNVLFDGASVFSTGGLGGYTDSVALSGASFLAAGWHTVTISWTAPSSMQIASRTLSVISAMR